MAIDQARLYLWSGLVWQAMLRAYWVSLVVRITVELDLPELQLVLLGTAMEASLLLAEVPTGVMADTFSRKWSVVVGVIGVGLAQIAAGIVSAFPLLVLTQVAWGVAYTFRSGAETAWITDELGGPGAVEALVLRRGRWQLAVAVVAILGGAGLARLTTLTTSVVATGVVLVATGVVLAVTMTEDGFDRATGARLRTGGLAAAIRAAGATAAASLRAGASTVAASRSLRILVIVLVVGGLAGEAIDRLDIRRLDDLGLSADHDEITLVGAIAAVEAALGAMVLWWGRARLTGPAVATGLAVMLGVSAIGIGALGLVAVLPVAAAGLIIQGGLRGAIEPLTTNWTNAHTPAHVRATVHSFIEQANSVGEVAGGVTMGALAAATTVPTAMAGSAVLVLVAAAVAGRGRLTWPTPGPVR